MVGNRPRNTEENKGTSRGASASRIQCGHIISGLAKICPGQWTKMAMYSVGKRKKDEGDWPKRWVAN